MSHVKIGRIRFRLLDCKAMKILMIAPEPIFEPRGTPLSVVGRLKALSDMGYRVDLLTYSIGKDIDLPGLRIFRIPRIPGIRKVKIGPSLTKVPLDICLMVKTAIRLYIEPYDLIHTHEEAGFWGTVFSRIFHVPHLYDMHSSLPQQLRNFQFTNSRILIRIFENLERWVLRNAQGQGEDLPMQRNTTKPEEPGDMTNARRAPVRQKTSISNIYYTEWNSRNTLVLACWGLFLSVCCHHYTIGIL